MLPNDEEEPDEEEGSDTDTLKDQDQKIEAKVFETSAKQSTRSTTSTDYVPESIICKIKDIITPGKKVNRMFLQVAQVPQMMLKDSCL